MMRTINSFIYFNFININSQAPVGDIKFANIGEKNYTHEKNAFHPLNLEKASSYGLKSVLFIQNYFLISILFRS